MVIAMLVVFVVVLLSIVVLDMSVHNTGQAAYDRKRVTSIAAAEAGATAVVQPGGSVRDAEVIAAADERGIAMVFTGKRHFRH